MEAATPKVSIIIPHYNQVECLKRLLPSIANQTFDDYEVIIIDDFTPDRSAPEYIRSLIKDYPKMRLVENTENMRFVRTCNKGIKLAKGDYICLLNQDTEVVNNFVQRNVEIMDADPSIGALSCIVVDKDGKNWFSGGRFKSGLNVNLVDDFQGVRTVDWVAGTAPFYRKEVFDKIGYLNEDFYMYHEDIEFCLRVRRRTNYQVCMFHEKLVTHYLDSNPDKLNRMLYYTHRNHILLLKKYARRYLPKVVFLNLREFIIYMGSYILKRNRHALSIAIPRAKGTLAGLIKIRVK
jgi:GT2 family glycosyltransferase